MKQRYIKCLLFLCLIPSGLSAQKVVFHYDACGNTTSMTKVLRPRRAATPDIANDSCESYKIGDYNLKLDYSSTTGVVSGRIVDFEGEYTIVAYDPRTNKMITRRSKDGYFSVNITNLTAGVIIIRIDLDDTDILKSIKIIKK